MQYEVETKHRIDDLAALEAVLRERRVLLGGEQVHIDRYFNHPSRDFAQTDEALRIRCIGEQNFLTYKGPKLDATTKTRREMELPIVDGQQGADDLAELLEALGFVFVTEVRKSRRSFALSREGHAVTGCIDEVASLGSYVELELIADEANLDEARRVIGLVAEDLGLGPSERRSYLEMLLDG